MQTSKQMGNGDEEKEGEEEGEGGRQASFRRRLVSAFGGHTAEAMTAATQCPGGGECGQQQQQLIKTSDSCANVTHQLCCVFVSLSVLCLF